ncbi:MAG: hypothetical protein KGJ41_05660 [Rhodospirillales bacterium]|nr:hypothetical protein [Rhodospirillales bacterium]MDE2198492.1 hypothetical protein [Rhodospirillales bacterium]MDE2576105.1 hypothetical protein [Rhodospirillales bacterium]
MLRIAAAREKRKPRWWRAPDEAPTEDAQAYTDRGEQADGLSAARGIALGVVLAMSIWAALLALLL